MPNSLSHSQVIFFSHYVGHALWYERDSMQARNSYIEMYHRTCDVTLLLPHISATRQDVPVKRTKLNSLYFVSSTASVHVSKAVAEKKRKYKQQKK